VLEAASAAGGLGDQTLESLVSGCLNLDFLGGEDDPVGDLTALRCAATIKVRSQRQSG